jgi:RNA polymerase sigma-70 factor (ECF subfamily)
MDDFADVLAAARTGQEWAVARLYDAIQPSLLGYLGWQEPAVAEDLASETWLAVAERIGGFEGNEGAFRAWIYSIARRRLADHRRRGVRRRTFPVPDDVLVEMADQNDPADLVVEAASTEEALARLTGALSPAQAEVVVLRVIGGLSVEETARVVSKRPGTVRMLQHRAIRRLAGTLDKESALRV